MKMKDFFFVSVLSLIVFLIIIIIGINFIKAETTIKDDINANTEWTSDNSPYIVTKSDFTVNKTGLRPVN
jgi:hypothetical protein